jgi:Cdc6-like AAA superfamily ATPase
VRNLYDGGARPGPALPIESTGSGTTMTDPMIFTKHREPEEVFTPKTIVSREMFARRNEPDLDGNPGLQDSLRDALREQGGQVLIYGDTGVGKSSLLRYAAEDEGMDLVSVDSLSSKQYEDLLEDAVRKLIDVKEIKRQRTTGGSAEVEGEAGISKIVSLKGRLRGEHRRQREFEVVEKPLVDVVIEAMRASGARLLAFDNFQNITEERDRSLVAQTMEFLSDRSDETDDIKIVVIGIADDAPDLLGGSGSFRRRTSEVGVPRMPDDEIEEILRNGFRFLELEVEPTALQQLVFYADGFPFFAHLLGLHVARAARRDKSKTVTAELIEPALARAASSVERSFEERTKRAFEAGGDVQPRRRILQILTDSPQREWRSADVIAEFERLFEARTDYAFLHVALAQLMSQNFGAMLKRTGPRNRYIYKFADPHMRPYLRITAFRDAAGTES